MSALNQIDDEQINSDRWLVSYSDLLTLMLAFFVVMYSIAQMNEEEYSILAENLQFAFDSNGAQAQRGSETVIDLGGSAGESTPREQTQDLADAGEVKQLGETVQQRFEGEQTLRLRGNEEWLEIELDANMLFEGGSTELTT
ncbi:MAG: flagellar motor protein MotB, partial [Pseudomonadales bacterium]